MYRRLLKYLLSCPEEDLDRMTLEEAGILTALFESVESTPNKQAPLSEIHPLIERWFAQGGPRPPGTDRYRIQPLLREVLDHIVLNGIDTLHRNELDFLAHVYDHLQRLDRPEHNERLHDIFEKFIESIRSRREALPIAPGLHGLEPFLLILTAEQIENAPPRDIKTFAGVKLPARGPVYTHTGKVRVLDFVPENCTLVVDGDSCYVNGYVLGRVAASEDCEVRDRVSGVIISGHGSIRTNTILDHAMAISKWGCVYANSSSNPELVFAGQRIRLQGDARLGTYAAPEIEIMGKVEGGDYSVSKQFTAEGFSRTDARDLIIQLPMHISCAIYGGFIEAEATHLISRITRSAGDAHEYKNLIEIAENECEYFASNGVMHLLSGELDERAVEHLARAQQRLAFLDRVIAGLSILSNTAEEKLAARSNEFQTESPAREKPSSEGFGMNEIEEEFALVKSEGPVDSDLDEETKHLEAANTLINKRNAPTPSTLVRLRERHASWRAERERLQKTVADLQARVRQSLTHEKLLDKQSAEISKTQLFTRILTTAKSRPVGDKLYERARTAFVQHMLRCISNRRKRIKNYRIALKKTEEKHTTLCRQLAKDFSLEAPTRDADKANKPTVTGKFGPDICICTEKFLLDETEVPTGSVIHTPPKLSKSRTYQRMDNRIVALD